MLFMIKIALLLDFLQIYDKLFEKYGLTAFFFRIK